MFNLDCFTQHRQVTYQTEQDEQCITKLHIKLKNNKINCNIYVSLQLSMQNAVSAQPCVGKLGISLVLLNFLGCNCGL